MCIYLGFPWIKIDWCHGMAGAVQSLDQQFYVLLAEKREIGRFQCSVIGRKIELGGVNGNAARPQAIDAVCDEIESTRD